MTLDSTGIGAHLTDDDLAAYLDGALSYEERRNAEAHLSACDDCRAQAIAAREAISTAPVATSAVGDATVSPARTLRSKRWQITGYAAAAAVIAAFATTLPRGTSNRDAERDGDPAFTGRPLVSVVSPGDGGQLSGERRFVWRRVSDDATYRFTIADGGGQPTFSATVQDTTIVLPAAVALARGQKFFWYVDALNPDGATASSGLKSFTLK